MRKSLIIGLLVLAGACHRTTTIETAPSSSRTSGESGASPRSALADFLGAVKAQDLQAMSLAWGDKNGPVRDSKSMSRQEMEQREVLLMRCFRHDAYRVVSELPGLDGERQMQVELARGTNKKVTDFFLAKGEGRWYVRSASLDPVREVCSAKG